MTIVQSRLTTPDGEPIRRHPVYAHLLGPGQWTADHTTRVVTVAEAWTDDTGLWQMNLVACDELEWGAHMRYRIVEGPFATHYARVPRSAEPVWLRHIRVPEHEITFTWEPDPAELLRVHLVCSGYGPAGCHLNLGDGTPPILVTSLDPVAYTFPHPGTFTVTGVDAHDPSITGSATVTVKDHPPTAHVYADSDDPWTALLWIDEPDDGTPYKVDWDDDTRPEIRCGQRLPRVPPHPRVPHHYTAAHQYRITVTDLSTKRHTHVHFFAGMIGVLLTYDQPNQLRLDAHWLATGATWEAQADGRLPLSGIVPPSGRITVQGKPDDPGDLRLEVRELIKGAVRRRAVRRRVIPTLWDWRMDVVMTWRDPTDLPGWQTVTVTPKGARTTCTVDWGDASPVDAVAPGQTAAHLYTLPAPPAGWRVRVTETGIDDPRTWTRLLAEPRRIGNPILAARTNGAVDLDAMGADQPYNDDWYTVGWDDGLPDPVGIVGSYYVANHVYSTPGNKVITIDGPGMAAPIVREIDVVIYPSPVVVVSEAVDAEGKVIDPNRMTAQISVDNTASGGPVLVRTGDGKPPRLCAEQETFTHTYTDPGTFYVIASSQADPTARGRAPVTVPFAQSRTLTYKITGVPNPDKPQDPIYRIRVTITAHTPGKVVRVQWEGGGGWTNVPPANWVEHPYPPIEGLYNVIVAYEDESEKWTTPVEMPWPGDEAQQ